MKESDIRIKICEIAESFVNTKYQHQGRLKDVGVDCAGLVICVAKETGFNYDIEYKDYGMIPDGNKLFRECKKFLKERSINEIKEARKYALKRVYNNMSEIENYMADKNYIYIPIIMDDLIVAYMGRLYNKKDNYARYNMKVVRKSPCLIGFYDEVINNMSTNSIYLTEGYFDSYAMVS